jgi:hypothetical protein
MSEIVSDFSPTIPAPRRLCNITAKGGTRMRLCTWLPFIAAAVLLVTPLPAQQDLPKSTQENLAAWTGSAFGSRAKKIPTQLRPSNISAGTSCASCDTQITLDKRQTESCPQRTAHPCTSQPVAIPALEDSFNKLFTRPYMEANRIPAPDLDPRPGAPFGTPIDPRMRTSNKNKKGLYDWSTFNMR